MGNREVTQHDRDKQARNEQRGAISAADWGKVDPYRIAQLVTIVGLCGGAVRFGYTRDRGAYCIGLYSPRGSNTFYARPTDDTDAWLVGLADRYFAEFGDWSGPSHNVGLHGAERHQDASKRGHRR